MDNIIVTACIVSIGIITIYYYMRRNDIVFASLDNTRVKIRLRNGRYHSYYFNKTMFKGYRTWYRLDNNEKASYSEHTILEEVFTKIEQFGNPYRIDKQKMKFNK